MAIATYNNLINSFNSQQSVIGFVSGAPGNVYASAYALAGTYQSATPASGSGATCDNTVGPIPYTSAGGSNTMYLARFGIWAPSNSSSAANLESILHDRLVATSGLSGTTLTSQTVNTVSLPSRASDGLGVELWIEWYTATGASGRNLTVNYTNQDGTSQTQVIAVAATRPASFAQRIPFLQNDKGVLSVQSVQWDASTGTAGNFGISLIKRFKEITIPAGNLSSAYLDPVTSGLPVIPASACLNIYLRQATLGAYDYEVVLVEG